MYLRNNFLKSNIANFTIYRFGDFLKRVNNAYIYFTRIKLIIQHYYYVACNNNDRLALIIEGSFIFKN